MPAFHRSLLAILCAALFPGMMISMNGTLVTSAASTSNSHQRSARHWGIDEQQSEEASPSANSTDAGVNVFDPAIHSSKDQPLSYANFRFDAVA